MGVLMHTILVTGAAGFIGYHLCKRLLTEGVQVIGIDNINDYYDTNLKYARLEQLGIKKSAELYGKSIQSAVYDNFTFIRLHLEDFDNINSIFDKYTFDTVINLAAQAGVRYSINHPFSYTSSNVTGFLSILEACRYHHVSHLVYASSSSVYGLNTQQPFSVHHGVDHPISLYAATKRANELMAHTYSHLYGIPTTGLRFFTVYGPWGRPDMAYYKFANAIIQEQPIEVYNNGDMYRDFTYIDDIIEGIMNVIYNPPTHKLLRNDYVLDPAVSTAPFIIYNIGNNRPEKLLDFITILEQKLGKKAIKQYLPIQMGDVYSTSADISDLQNDFGWRPHTNLEEGLDQFCSWFLKYYSIRA